MSNSLKLITALVAAGTLSACTGTDIERGTIGAVGGALAAEVTNNDPVQGALVGGAAGVVCDDVGVCNN